MALSQLDIQHTVYTYECHLLKKFESDPELGYQWLLKLKKKAEDDSFDLGEIPHALWYLAVTLDRKKEHLLSFVQEWAQRLEKKRVSFNRRETLLSLYLNCHKITHVNIDGIFKYGDDNTLPDELFRCPSVRWLSMKYNYLDKLPPDIGRMSNLEHLELTNNKLQNKSLPNTLTFCKKLRTLMLDNNLLDALPGFLLQMSSLKTVHRHGNHNYFKSTFMWYHTDVNERILGISGSNESPQPVPSLGVHQPKSLQFWAARAVVGLKINFYTDPWIAPILRDYISEIYVMFNVCGCCNNAKLKSQPGYKVITFKNPYLGNTCVPFQHWACSLKCAQAIEIPARHEQIAAARQLDREYDVYVRDCQKQYLTFNSAARRLRYCGSSRTTQSVVDGDDLSDSEQSYSAETCGCVVS